MSQQITGIQRWEAPRHSDSKFSNHDFTIECAEFVVTARKDRAGDVQDVELFFPRIDEPEQGVGLRLPSRQIAFALARALISVAEGHLSEARGSFPY